LTRPIPKQNASHFVCYAKHNKPEGWGTRGQLSSVRETQECFSVLRTRLETLKNSKKNFWRTEALASGARNQKISLRVRTAFCSSSHSQNFESWELRLSRARNPKRISDCDKLDLKVGVQGSSKKNFSYEKCKSISPYLTPTQSYSLANKRE
jgi:hypothetical protein